MYRESRDLCRQSARPPLLDQTLGRLRADQKMRTEIWVCFVRKLCPVFDLAFQFSVPVTEIVRLNPGLGQFPSVPGGALILLPALVGAAPAPQSPHRAADFMLT